MKYPTIFVNHGGGPLPLLGRQPALANHMKQVRSLLDSKPAAIVVFSAHWESDLVRISSSPQPSMLYDYSGFPPESYEYQYPAPGSPDLAAKIRDLLGDNGIQSELDDQRGFDHGVFVPLMLMYPEADIPVVAVSLHNSLAADTNMAIGQALAPLREDNILLLGSGYTFHNMHAFFNPTEKTYQAAKDFNSWLKDTIMSNDRLERLQQWEQAPGARVCHPREEHLLPLLMTAAAADGSSANLIYESGSGEHAVSSYLFQ